jgi:hypothetical protein
MLGLVVMIGALIGLYEIGVLFTAQPIAIALQLMAVALMVWARITFGRRSFMPLRIPPRADWLLQALTDSYAIQSTPQHVSLVGDQSFSTGLCEVSCWEYCCYWVR